ncbi:hypothetical protein P691DRAFT_806971 [Macrolepiota fuliginosa MF-IS2]|uniref:SMODS and SLOG-associating 2TM effector domain-containing protein n=1 Tax=Macrolepiota fuliginosa MF-IS2 TaxID=1400762 RepID=A0A9P6C0K3_9AGAR|nr:hypothetical protein P691DRAFT_806971 [Macrolepiota fuliginosa MF-IS2]
MDRSGTPPAAPPATTPGITQALAPAIQGAPSGPPPTLVQSSPEFQQPTASQQPTQGDAPAQAPSQLSITTTHAPQQGPQSIAMPQPSPHQLVPTQTAEPPIASGPRPTTGSTLGGLTSDSHQPPDPQAPPIGRPPYPQLRIARPTSTGMKTPSEEKLEDMDTLSGLGINELHRDSALRTNQPLPALPPVRLGDSGMPRRQRTLDGHGSAVTRRSGIDWIVPVDEKRRKTVGERIQPTLDIAISERDKYAVKAKATAWALNSAIGLQVVLGSLTTGLSAVATTGKQTAITTTILGGLSTVVASYLARARGSNEPELSITRVKDLEQFIREAEAFQLDHGHIDTNEWDKELEQFRRRFEELLGNANGERKLSPPV